MANNSIHDKLEKTRKPRVHINYEVETNGAIEKKELPFVIGVLGDYSGNNPGAKKPSLRDRKFIQVDNDNLDEVMATIKPGAKIRVPNKIANDDSEMSLELSFNKVADFEPEAIVNQVEPLRKLLETRNQLRDLLTKADRSEELEDLLEKILTSNEELSKLASDIKKD